MKKSLTKTVLLLLVCAALALCAVGCDRIVGPNAGKNNPGRTGSSSSESSVDPLHSVAEGEGMSQYDIHEFFGTYGMPFCTAINYFGGEGTPYNSKQIIEDNGVHWAPTTTIYETLADLENYASVFFGGSFLSDLRTVAGLEGDDYPPRYRDINGKLYIRTDDLNEPLKFDLDSKTIEVVSNTVNEVKLTIDGTLNDKPCQVRVILSRTKDAGWHITYFVPDMTGDSSAPAGAPAVAAAAPGTTTEPGKDTGKGTAKDTGKDPGKDSGKENNKTTGSNASETSKPTGSNESERSK